QNRTAKRDRRVIDPPPILQMDVDAPNAAAEGLKALIRQPYAVVHCTLWDPVNNRDDTAMPGTTDKRQQRRLMSALVASPPVGNDENDVEGHVKGCFSYFPDLSVRTPGTYSLIFKLVTLNPLIIGPGYGAPVRSTAMSSAFNVYNAKNFGSMSASTELTKNLKHQGVWLVLIKKGNAKKNEREEDEDDDDDED
ncbi:velvet factor, partial [Hyaloscypha finlandica]